MVSLYTYCCLMSMGIWVLHPASAWVMQAALRQFINEVMIRTGAVAAAGFPIITCKVYAVSNVTK